MEGIKLKATTSEQDDRMTKRKMKKMSSK